jgi:putative FmdB family regulatory protein
MPIYLLKCSSCKYEFDKIRPFARSTEDEECPKCKGVGKRVYTAPSPAQVAGGTFAQRGKGLKTLGDFSDVNSWVDS